MASGTHPAINIFRTQTLIITMGTSRSKADEEGVECRCPQEMSWHWAGFRPLCKDLLTDDVGRDCYSIFLTTTKKFKIEPMSDTLQRSWIYLTWTHKQNNTRSRNLTAAGIPLWDLATSNIRRAQNTTLSEMCQREHVRQSTIYGHILQCLAAAFSFSIVSQAEGGK